MEDQEISTPDVVKPNRPLPRKYLEAIIYLTEKMASSNKAIAAIERHTLEKLVKDANISNFRMDHTFRELNEDKACAMLDIDIAKQGALVIMSLVLKADHRVLESENRYFERIRHKLRIQAVTVPADIGEHEKLALMYLKN